MSLKQLGITPWGTKPRYVTGPVFDSGWNIVQKKFSGVQKIDK